MTSTDRNGARGLIEWLEKHTGLLGVEKVKKAWYLSTICMQIYFGA